MINRINKFLLIIINVFIMSFLCCNSKAQLNSTNSNNNLSSNPTTHPTENSSTNYISSANTDLSNNLSSNPTTNSTTNSTTNPTTNSISSTNNNSQNYYNIISESKNIKPGAESINSYLPLLKGKVVGVVANQTSVIDNVHLVDTLLSLKINIKCIFSPEHGFRGNASAGAHIEDGVDVKTNLPVISLYGNNKKPKQSQLKGLDIVVFDLQDVGTRFYTYISTLTYVMEACAEANIPIIVLDRPNPNAHYVDGPVLESGYESFVGMHKIPVVYGMTIGEYAKMVNGERWISPYYKNDNMLTIIPISNYSHSSIYELPVAPSPNLKNMSAIWLYPTLCFFEGTVVSVGRGTNNPFELLAHPKIKNGDTIVTPVSIKGVADNPKLKNVRCNAYNFINLGYQKRYNQKNNYYLDIDLIINLYNEVNIGKEFFTSFFDKLAGTNKLRQQIIEGKTSYQIRKSWENDINNFLKIRSKYLIYPN